MPINVNDPEYLQAELEYHNAKTTEEKLEALERMISHAPKHKGGENLRQQLTQRRKRLEKEIEKGKKKGGSHKKGIKKGEMQAVLVGKTNSGKSSILKALTNSNPKISQIPFTTNEPTLGILEYEGTQIQLVEIPAIDGDDFEKGIVHTSDTIVIVVNSFKEIDEIKKTLPKNNAKEMIAFNKSDLLTKEEKRKISARLQSKKFNFEIISSIKEIKDNNLEKLKEKIFESFDMIRVFTKEPGKEKKERPMVLEPNSTVKDAAEKILTGFSKKIIETRIWGPSSKFSGQVVGLNHKLKDMDTVEFKTK